MARGPSTHPPVHRPTYATRTYPISQEGSSSDAQFAIRSTGTNNKLHEFDREKAVWRWVGGWVFRIGMAWRDRLPVSQHKDQDRWIAAPRSPRVVVTFSVLVSLR
jgi:hypothetical protein